MKEVMFHWVWVGPCIPIVRLKKIANMMRKMPRICKKSTKVKGALWYLQIANNEKVTGSKSFARSIPEIKGGENLNFTFRRKQNHEYQNMLQNKIKNRCWTYFEEGDENESAIKIPVFKMPFDNELAKWVSKKKIPLFEGNIGALIAVSDALRLKVLAQNTGMYLDFDVTLNKNKGLISKAGKKLIGNKYGHLACHTKPGNVNKYYYENDLVWVAPTDDGSEIIGSLYNAIVNDDDTYLELYEGDTESDSENDMNPSSTNKLNKKKEKEKKLKLMRARKIEYGLNKKSKSKLNHKRHWDAIHGNITGFTETWKRCCNRILRMSSKDREHLRGIVLNYGRGDVITLRVDKLAKKFTAEEFPNFEKSLYKNSSPLFDKWSYETIVIYRREMATIFDDLGMSSYQTLMHSWYDEDYNKSLKSFFDNETWCKSFYSWRDPGYWEIYCVLIGKRRKEYDMSQYEVKKKNFSKKPKKMSYDNDEINDYSFSSGDDGLANDITNVPISSINNNRSASKYNESSDLEEYLTDYNSDNTNQKKNAKQSNK